MIAPVHMVPPMSTVAEIEAAIAKLPPAQKWEIVRWLEESLLVEETPAMLVALDEGIQSLKAEPTVSAEEVRRKIKGWATG